MSSEDIILLLNCVPFPDSGNPPYWSVMLTINVGGVNQFEKGLNCIDLHGFRIFENGTQNGKIKILGNILFSEFIPILTNITQEIDIG